MRSVDEQSIFTIVSFAVLVVATAALGFWAWMLGECLAYEPGGGYERPLWTVLIALLAPPVGAIAYFVIRRPHRIARFGE